MEKKSGRSRISRSHASMLAAGLLIAACAGALGSSPARAQAYPTHQVTIMVGFLPGGPIDWMARVLAPVLQKKWGQPVIVENRAGAGGILAVQAVQKAPPDGHVLMAQTQAMAMLPLFMKQADVEPGRNLQPLGRVFDTPYVIVTSAASPGKTLREFLDYAKANPGKLNAALAAQTVQYLDSESFIKAAGVNMQVINYKGGIDAVTSILSNESQILMATGLLDPHIKAGKMKALAVTSASRFPIYPDLPTVKEAAGFDYVTTVDFGYYTTQGTPKPVVDKMSHDIAEAMDTPDMKEQVMKQGFQPDFLSADEWQRKIANDLRRAKDIAQSAGITPQ
jgi:tripartite-type tricarboxylate transporter receptor subunit TctC